MADTSTHIETKHTFKMSWSIPKFNKILEDQQVSKELESSSLKTAEPFPGTWKLSLVPLGIREGHPGHMSVFIEYRGETSYQLESSSFTIISKMGRHHSFKRGKQLLSSNFCIWGCCTFISHDMLKHRAKDLYPNGVLKIKFEGEVMTRVEVTTHEVVVRYPELSSNLKQLYDSNMDSDVTILTRGEPIAAHRLILSMQSPVFAGMFRHDTVENQSGIIKIEHVRPDILGAMVRHMYTDEEPENMSELAEEFLMVADMYDLPRLKELCEYHLAATINLENVIQVLILTDRYNANQLKNVCLHFAKDNLQKLTQGPNWNEATNLSSQMLADLLSRKFKGPEI